MHKAREASDRYDMAEREGSGKGEVETGGEGEGGAGCKGGGGRGDCAGEIVASRGLLIRRGVEDGMRTLGEPECERGCCLGGVKKGV